jgi:hypothetical protein
VVYRVEALLLKERKWFISSTVFWTLPIAGLLINLKWHLLSKWRVLVMTFGSATPEVTSTARAIKAQSRIMIDGTTILKKWVTLISPLKLIML